MPDRARPREMRRVIVPGGRAVLTTWSGNAQQARNAVLDEVAHARAGKHFDQAFSLSDAQALNELLVEAKFFAVTVETVTRQVRVPDPARFARMPLTGLLGDALTDDIVADALAKLAPFVDGDALVFPMSSLIATARVKT